MIIIRFIIRYEKRMINHIIWFFAFQWRLRCFWKYLRENCYIEYEQMESLWEEMKDVVIKTLLISHKGINIIEKLFSIFMLWYNSSSWHLKIDFGINIGWFFRDMYGVFRSFSKINVQLLQITRFRRFSWQ